MEQFLTSDKIEIPSLFHQDPLRKRILFSLHMDLITQHLLQYAIEQNTMKLEPVFDGERPIGCTRDMRTWYTTRIAEPTQRSPNQPHRGGQRLGEICRQCGGSPP